MNNNTLRSKLISIAIKELLANRWNVLDMKRLSKLSKYPLEKVLLECNSKHNLIDYWSDNINFEMVENLSISELKLVSKKERVLELMLCRFDVIQSKAREVKALIKISKKSIVESSFNFNRAIKGMKLILDYSDISTRGSYGLIKIKALTLIWLLTLREWSKGELKNEEAIMAVLDKRLVMAEKLNHLFI